MKGCRLPTRLILVGYFFPFLSAATKLFTFKVHLMENIFVTLQKIGTGIAFSLLVISGSLAQSNIQQSLSVNGSGTAADASAQLDVSATDKGMLVPRMTSAQRTAIASPATGLLVFDTDAGSFWFYNGAAWVDLSSSKTLADADNDTKIQVEESPNEDIIRFDVAGTEAMVITNNGRVGIGTTAPGHPLQVQADGYGIVHTFGGVGLSTFIGDNAGWFGTISNHPLYLYTNDDILPAMSIGTTGRVGIGNTSPHASALLDLTATDKGMLVPRMTSAQRTAIASPATGLLVYDTNTNAFWFYNGTAWTTIGGGGVSTLIADADNDTKIQVEESADEDIIRFDLGGTENMVLLKNAGGLPRLELPNASESTFVGQDAGANITSGVWNTAIGFSALTATTTGAFNTAIGWKALTSNTSGYMNSAFGIETLFNNTTGYNNTAIGRQSLFSNTSGFSNTAAGDEALKSNTIGSANTAMGRFSLKSNTNGTENTAVGYNALTNTTTGTINTALGSSALKENTTGGGNVAIGRATLEKNTTGNSNVAIGPGAMFNNTIGSDNTACGLNALTDNSGNNNTGFGRSSLSSNSTGANNTGLGAYTNVSAGNLTNATVIGANASVNASDKVRIGNASVTVIEGQVDWTFPSDARFKFNIHDDQVPGLAFINQLRPVTYQFDTRKFDEHLMQNMPDSIQQSRLLSGLAVQDYSKSSATVQTGFLAQEVEQVCKKLGYEFSGLHVPTSDVDNYGLAYGSFVPLLVKAVQEQQMEIENLKSELHASKLKKLEIENAALKAQLEAQTIKLDKITAALAGAGIEVEE